ncbi:MAG: sensor histidine kinase [Candidatus Aquicultorales bacterium]
MRSIRSRLTAWFVIVLGVILTLFGVFAYQTIKTRMLADIVQSLHTETAAVEKRFGQDAALIKGTDGVSSQNTAVLVFNRPGRMIESSHPRLTSPVDTRAVASALNDGESKLARITAGSFGEVLVYTAPVVEEGEVRGAVQAARSLKSYNATLATLRLSLVVFIPFCLALAAAGGLFMSTKALSPVQDITNTARVISAHNLDERIEVKTLDEVGELAGTINDLLARLQASMEKDRRFAADASHELRTPLTAMRGEIEVALARERGGDEYRTVLLETLDQVEEMSSLVEGLLTLARLDGSSPLEIEEVYLEELLIEAAVQVRKAHPEKKDVAIDVSADGRLTVKGDRVKLKQLFGNLIDNAVKFSPLDGRVCVEAASRKGLVAVTVRDEGQGIAPQDLPFVFDRFYRADAARANGQGSGIGLSIALRIAEAHGGGIAVESQEGGGSTFIVRLPNG